MAEAKEEIVDEALPTDPAQLIELLEQHKRIAEVCQSLREMIEPGDDHYVVQIELASLGVVPALVDLLSAEDTADLIQVCETLSAMCANIEGVNVRKRAGLQTGFVERSFNPVQNEVGSDEGIRKLVNLLDAEAEVRDVAAQTLWSCCSFNHSNKVAYLRCLIHDLLKEKNDRLEHISALLPDIEVRGDVTVLLDQVMLPVVQMVKNESHTFRTEAMVLMGMLAACHPASATFLCDEGAMEPIVQIILKDEDLRPRAIHVLWNLIRRNKNVVNPEKRKMGCEGTLLVDPLVSVIGLDKKKDADAEQDEQEDDYSDEALLVLKALAEHDEDVREKVGDSVDIRTSRCAVM